MDLNEPAVDISNLISLRTILSKHESILHVSRRINEAYLIVYIKKSRAIISLMNEHGASFGFGGEDSADFNPKKTSSLVLIGILIILAQQKRYDLFNTVLNEGHLKEAIKEIPEILNYLVPHLLNTNNLDTNLGFIYNCLEETDSLDFEILTTLQLLYLRESKNISIRNAVLSFFEKRLANSEKHSSENTIAVDLMNLGHFHKQQGDLHKALNYYNKARKKHSSYLKTEFFLRDLAGLLFDSKKYKMSALLYKKAIEIDNSNPFSHASYGDALLFNGYYSLAQEQYDYFLSNANSDYFHIHECHLKFACIATLLENNYPAEQKRLELKALRLADPEKLESGDVFYEKLTRAIELDLLCSLAWFNIAHENLKREDSLQGFIAFTMSGLINRWDLESWLNATIIGFQTDDSLRLIHYVVNTAYFYCGEEYILKLTERLKDMPKLIQLIDSLIEKPKERTREFRIVGEDGDFEVVALTP